MSTTRVLGILARVRRLAVDERQREIAGLDRITEETQALADGLLLQRDAELNAAGPDPFFMRSTGLWLKGLDTRRDELQRTLADLARRREAAAEALREQYAELKTVEVLAERRAAEERAELDRKEQIAFDDMAIERYRRANTSPNT